MKNEYTIFDYLKVILKGKFIIIGVMFVSLFFGGLFLSLSPSEYEGALIIEEPENLSELAEEEVRYSEIEDLNGKITLKLKGKNEEEVAKLLKEDFLRVKEEYEEMFLEKQEEKEKKIELQREIINSLENQLDYLEKQASALGEMAMRSQDVSSIFFFFTAQEKAESLRRNLLEENYKLGSMEKEREDLQEIRVRDVSVRDKSSQSERTFMLAFVLGFVGGILIVLFKDWWENENAI